MASTQQGIRLLITSKIRDGSTDRVINADKLIEYLHTIEERLKELESEKTEDN